MPDGPVMEGIYRGLLGGGHVIFCKSRGEHLALTRVVVGSAADPGESLSRVRGLYEVSGLAIVALPGDLE